MYLYNFVTFVYYCNSLFIVIIIVLLISASFLFKEYENDIDVAIFEVMNDKLFSNSLIIHEQFSP